MEETLPNQEHRWVRRFASVDTTIALGRLSAAEFDQINDTLYERYATSHNPNKKAQIWQDMCTMEEYLAHISTPRGERAA